MHLSELSIRRPVFAWMLMLGLILFGALSFSRMGISQLPDVDFPVITVSVTYQGASPEVVEANVVDPLEDAIITVEGVRTITSTARYESASISVEFELGRNIDVALQEIQTKVAQAQRNLPDDVDTPTMTKSNPEDQPIMWIAVSSDQMSFRELSLFVRDRLKDRFSTVPGVGDIILGGYVDPSLRVWVSNEKLKRYELTMSDVLEAVSGEHSELPAGQLVTAQKEYDLRTIGEAKTLEEFQSLPLISRGGRPNYQILRLTDVARVEPGLQDVRRISRNNGIPAIGLGIRKQRGTNAVAVADAVKARLEEVQKQVPASVKLAVNFDSTTFIRESVNELNFTLVLSAIFTALVCWLFLGSLSSTFNILLAIPTSIVGTFTILYFAGFTLNTFTLLGLSLAVGIVVDDAIMVLENIVRYREQGKSRFEAAILGAKEISFAALASTISIVAIFLPVAFMRGVIGAFFLQFGVTLTVAVLLSLLEALTLTPMRAASMVEKSKRRTSFGRAIDRALSGITHIYRRVLDWSLQHPYKVVTASLLIFVASLFSITQIPREFVPAQDQGRFLARLQTPVGSSLAFTDQKFKEAEEIILKLPEIERVYAAIGGFGGGEVTTGIMFITMKEEGARGIREGQSSEFTQAQMMDEVRTSLRGLSDLTVRIQDLSVRGFSASRGFPLEFSIRGPELAQLGKYAGLIMKELEEKKLAVDLDTDYRLGKPEIQFIPDRERAAQFGVSVRQISETIRSAVGGVNRGKYSEGGRRYDIRVQLEEADRSEVERMKDLWVRNNRGEPVRLSQVVKVVESQGLQQITRYDRERAVSVFGNFQPGVSQDIVQQEIEAIAARVLPDRYRLIAAGSSKGFAESFQDLKWALWLGVIIAFMVLASQFNHLIHPITVLMALPFSITGACLALWMTGQSLNVYSFIGLILLMGIVKKNSIMLVEFTNQIRERGEQNVVAALKTACPIRLRPILMTTFSTVAGALPPAMALGPGWETRMPMAIAVIGGVLVSTFLTLFVVPCVYLIFESILVRMGVSHQNKTSMDEHREAS